MTKRTKGKPARANKSGALTTIPRRLGTVTTTSWTPPEKRFSLDRWIEIEVGRAFGSATSTVRW
jgi:hypothetical protein